MKHALNNRHSRSTLRGFTLIELLVAITLLVLISFLMVPFVTNLVAQMQNRGVTGASRTIQATFALARDQALRTASPYGIRFIRDEDDPWLCRRIQFLQSPPALTAKNPLKIEPGGGLPEFDDDGDNLTELDPGEPFPEVWEVSGINTSWLGLVRQGDHLRVTNTGPLYEILGPDISPRDGLIDMGEYNYNNQTGIWRMTLAAEPYPNRDGYGRSTPDGPAVLGYGNISRGKPLVLDVYRYQIQRQPVPAADQDEIVLPPGVVIDLKLSIGLWNQIPTGSYLMGNDGQYGLKGIDDNGDLLTDDPWEMGTPGTDDPPASSWPTMDILFSATGEMTDLGAQAAVIHLWVGPEGLTSSDTYNAAVGRYDPRTPEELAENRLVSVYTRTGFVQVNEINAADFEPKDGYPDDPYAFAKAAYGARAE